MSIPINTMKHRQNKSGGTFLSVLAIAAAITSFPTPSHSLPIDILPKQSVSAVGMNWVEANRNIYLRNIMQVDRLEFAFLGLGVSPTAVTDIALFSDAKKPTSFYGIILQGSFEPDAVHEYLTRNGWEEDTYQGRRLCVSPDNDARMAILESGMVVMGSRSGIERVIEAESNPASRLVSHPFYESALKEGREKNAPVTMFMAFPQTWRDVGNTAIELTAIGLNAVGFGPLGEVFKTMGFAKGISCSLVPDGNGILVDLSSAMKDESSAGFASGLLNILKGATRLIPENGSAPEDREALKNFQNMIIDREGEILKVSFRMPESVLIPGRVPTR